MISLSIGLQVALLGKFIHEAITTRLGTYCRVKCSLAALLYGSVAFLLTWQML